MSSKAEKQKQKEEREAIKTELNKRNLKFAKNASLEKLQQLLAEAKKASKKEEKEEDLCFNCGSELEEWNPCFCKMEGNDPKYVCAACLKLKLDAGVGWCCVKCSKFSPKNEATEFKPPNQVQDFLVEEPIPDKPHNSPRMQEKRKDPVELDDSEGIVSSEGENDSQESDTDANKIEALEKQILALKERLSKKKKTEKEEEKPKPPSKTKNPKPVPLPPVILEANQSAHFKTRLKTLPQPSEAPNIVKNYRASLLKAERTQFPDSTKVSNYLLLKSGKSREMFMMEIWKDFLAEYKEEAKSRAHFERFYGLLTGFTPEFVKSDIGHFFNALKKPKKQKKQEK